jgi:predicted  nucleic acid-binding Zn-ribbon protein
MPHWNCERCGSRLYSASKTLRQQACPVCQGRLAPESDPPPSGRFEHRRPLAVDLSDAPVVREEVDVPEHL